MAFLWFLCGFREGTVDSFLYKLIKIAKFAIFLMELSLPARKFLAERHLLHSFPI